jgi:Uma2 family endonuclease
MGAVSTHPITIEEFGKLDLPKDRRWELHNGELVEVSFASVIHKHLQRQLSNLLERGVPPSRRAGRISVPD